VGDQNILKWIGIIGLSYIHLTVLSYGTRGNRRGIRTAIAYLFAFDWALGMGALAARSITHEPPFWSWHTAIWALLSVLFLFLPTWLLFRYGLRFSGIFLLPVIPIKSKRRSQAGRTLRAYMWGLNYPFYREEDGKLQKAVDGKITLRYGGPGFVLASSHYAIPLTAGPVDTQVGGRGLVFTARKERPRSLVDLRLQVRAEEVHAVTRDGISVKMMAFIVFQIDRRSARVKGLYPFDPKAVAHAAEIKSVGPVQDSGEHEEIEWEQVVAERGTDLLRDAIARTLLDQLLEGYDEDGDKPPREALRGDVGKKLAEEMAPHGIHVFAVGLSDITVEDEEVLEQRIATWAAHWKRERLEREAQGEAQAVLITEKARADTQRQMVIALNEAFQQLADTETPIPPQVIALRFIDMLEDMATSPDLQGWMPNSWQLMPEQLRLAMSRNNPDGGQEDA
jgi:regulator of protease activity HflC (stomatin/prohibitin superfamily)